MCQHKYTSQTTIQPVTLSDAEALLAIYAPYVRDTAITFEYTVPTIAEFQNRIQKISSRYPYLAAWQNGEITGYAYASVFKDRAAYDWSAETSIYVRQDCHGSGIGSRLYRELESILVRQNLCSLCACIAYPNPESIAFHEKHGYRQAAHFHQSGFKFGTWYDMIWMEKILKKHPFAPKPFIPITEVLL